MNKRYKVKTKGTKLKEKAQNVIEYKQNNEKHFFSV